MFYISGALAIHDPQSSPSQETHEKQGYLLSHRDFPNDYTASINSTLIIAGLQPQQIVRVKFLEFQLYSRYRYPGCGYDYLQITGSGGRTFCSDSAPKYQPNTGQWYEFTATDSQLKFQFVTNSNQNSIDKGFYLQYKGECAFVYILHDENIHGI